jgi:hypothetical protein
VCLIAADDAVKPINVELKSFTFKVAKDKESLFGHNTDNDKLFFYTNGKAEAKVKVPVAGDYEIIVKASCDIAQKEGAKFKVAVEDKQVGKETETSDEEKEYKFPITLKAGEQKVTIEFTNDVYKEGDFDRNLYVHVVTVKKVK